MIECSLWRGSCYHGYSRSTLEQNSNSGQDNIALQKLLTIGKPLEPDDYAKDAQSAVHGGGAGVQLQLG